MKTTLKILSLTTVLTAFVPLAMATPLTLGGPALATTQTTSAASTGTFVAGTPVGGTAVTALTFNGSFVETVYANASGDVLAGCSPGSGCLDYVFTFSNQSDSADAIELATMANFLGYTVDAEYIAGPGIAPITVSLNSFGTVNFNFASTPTGSVAPGKASDTLVLYTNATRDSGGFFGLADGTNKTVRDFGPAAPSTVPEPSSLMLLGTGLLTAVGVARRKLKA